MPPSQAPPQMAVLDTNIVLDLFLFQDPRCETLRQAIAQGELTWYATAHMRNELKRVLTYANIATKLAFYQKSSEDILAAFDQSAHITAAPEQKAPYTCKDADDQVFIDLAHALAQHHPGQPVHLISKDKAVLSMRKRLAKLSILVNSSHIAMM